MRKEKNVALPMVHRKEMGLHLRNKNRKKYLEIIGKENDASFSQRDSPEKHQGSAA